MKTSSVKSALIYTLQLLKMAKIEFTSSLTCLKSKEPRRTINFFYLSSFLFNLKMLRRMIKEESTFLKLLMTRESFLLEDMNRWMSESVIELYLDSMQSLNIKATVFTSTIAILTSVLLF